MSNGTYYRAFLQREYSDDKDNWRDEGWDFSEQDPTEYIKDWDNMSSKSVSPSFWRIKYLHIISEEDYAGRKIYTKPIEQIIFYQ